MRVSVLQNSMECEHNASDHDLLVRIDEKVVAVHARMDEFVTRDEFKPVKLISYSLVSISLLAVLTALIQLVIKK